MHCQYKSLHPSRTMDTKSCRTPLYHFATNDLPSDSKAPELDDRNAVKALHADAKWSGDDVSAGAGVTEKLMGLYLSYVVTIGFMPSPSGAGKTALPPMQMNEQQREALRKVGGRGALT